jgi:hypothetical protein
LIAFPPVKLPSHHVPADGGLWSAAGTATHDPQGLGYNRGFRLPLIAQGGQVRSRTWRRAWDEMLFASDPELYRKKVYRQKIYRRLPAMNDLDTKTAAQGERG